MSGVTSNRDTITRHALGRSAALGDLYNARTDKFCSISALQVQLPAAISETDIHHSEISLSIVSNLEQKFRDLNVSGELQLSVLAGFVDIGTSAQYLSKNKGSFKSVECTVLYNIKTRREHLELSHEVIKNYINSSEIGHSQATHVVIDIEWGANCVITVTDQNSDNRKQQEVGFKLWAKAEKLKELLGTSISAEAGVKLTKEQIEEWSQFKFEFSGDVIQEASGEIPQTVQGALTFMGQVPELIAKCNGGKGKPLKYVMLPVSYLLLIALPISTIPTEPFLCVGDAGAAKIVRLFDRLMELKQKTHDVVDELTNHSNYVAPFEKEDAKETQRRLENHVDEAKAELATLLQNIRSERQDEGCLDLFYENRRKTAKDMFRECKKVHEAVQARIEFIRRCEKFGAEYLPLPAQQSIDSACVGHMNVYVLFHGQADDETRKRNESAFIELAKENKNVSGIACFITLSKRSKDVRIKHFRNGNTLVHNDVAKQLGERNVAMCVPEARRARCLMPFKVPCPGTWCSREERSWTCVHCNETLQFCPDNSALYCNCGHSMAKRFRFRCCHDAHGSDFKQFTDNTLQTAIDRHMSAASKGNYLVKLFIRPPGTTVSDGLMFYP